MEHRPHISAPLLDHMFIKYSHGTAYMQRIPGYGWYLSSIVVDEGFRSQGIGTKLMTRIIRESGGLPIYLLATSELGSDLKRLKRFYRRFGFRTLSKSELRQLNIFPYNANMVLHGQ